MKYLKKYILPVSALVFIVLGASLPYLTLKMQDNQISRFREKMELSTINLTLRQESDVLFVLQLISKEHTESSWTGKTVLTKAEASRAALTVMETLDRYSLLPEGELELLKQTDGDAEPFLLVGEDGSSALVWACTWHSSPGTYITLDDATGKAVRILTANSQTELSLEEEVYIQQNRWNAFLQSYYDIKLTEVKERESGYDLTTSFVMCFSSKDDTIKYEFNLELESGLTFFNY